MAKAELKTKPTKLSVTDFLNSIGESQKRHDCFFILKMIEKITKEKPKMWGSAIIGFCDVTLKYPSGRELDWFKIGFSPRKANITLYLCGNLEMQKSLLLELGKHKTGVGCLYINKLEDVDTKILQQMIEKSFEFKNPTNVKQQ